jgi:ATP-dependent DNA helicase RecG
MLPLATPVDQLYKVGPAYAKLLKKLGIFTFGDLLRYFPFRYSDLSRLTPIASIQENSYAVVQAKILSIQNRTTWKKRMLITEAILEDTSGSMLAVWFNQPYLADTLKPGTTWVFAGKATRYDGKIQLQSPEYEPIKKEQVHTQRIVPIYRLTEGLWLKWFRSLVKTYMEHAAALPDFLPPDIRTRTRIMPLALALKEIHFPSDEKRLHLAKRRFAFEELFLIQLSVLSNKREISHLQAPQIPFSQPLIKSFVDALPFTLTRSQKSAAWEILKDIEKSHPMNRLLQGDVGSGKTVVAAIATLEVAKIGYQTAYMAPTEILAQQHFATMAKLLAPQGIPVALLTGNTAKTEGAQKNFRTKTAVLAAIKRGEISVVIGTHALIQKSIRFKDLALVIVDEQHRFGVSQRASLITRGRKQTDTQRVPHFLSMTATPIPRTLALSIYGDLDISLLTEMPKGRLPVITKVVPPDRRGEVYAFMKQEIKAGRQAFVILPVIDPTDKLEVKSAKEEYQRLRKEIFPSSHPTGLDRMIRRFRIALLHGRMKAAEKEKTMQQFKDGKIDILVATSVVEVGIDVPNASVMVIEGAERFGLAQMHQLRGRVGRGMEQAHCFLFTESVSDTTIARLQALTESANSFELAEKDLAIRGPGEVYGERQWGFAQYKMMDLWNITLIKQAREEADKLLKEGGELARYPALKERLREYHLSLHLE